MKINFNKQSFYGYKNLMHTDINSGSGRFVLFAMQLDDYDGHQDLSYFKRLLRDYGAPETDVLTLIMAKDGNQTPRMVLNDSTLFSGSEMEFLNNPIMLKKYSKQDLKKIEKFNIRAYTLLANLTNRLMNTSRVLTDEGKQHTKMVVGDILKESFPNIGYVTYILCSVLNEKKPFQEIALEINKRIDSRMKRFFKIV